MKSLLSVLLLVSIFNIYSFDTNAEQSSSFVTNLPKEQNDNICGCNGSVSAVATPFWDGRSVFAFLALIISLLHIAWTIQSKKGDKKRSIVDEFWLRKVIIPKILEALDEYERFVNTSMPKFHSVTTKEQLADKEVFSLSLLPKLNDIRDSIGVLGTLDRNESDKLIEILEVFEDNLNNFAEDELVEFETFIRKLYPKLIEYLINQVHLKTMS